MRAMVIIAMKDLRVLVRDKMALFWTLGFPLMLALFFGAITGGGGPRGKIEIAVDDQDGSDGSRAFVARLGTSASLQVTALPAGKARDEVRRGELVAYVVVRKGFGARSLFGPAGDDDAAALEVGIDPARSAEAGLLEGLLVEASFAGLQDKFADPRAMREEAARNLKLLEGDTGMPPDQKELLARFLGDMDRFFAGLKTDPGGGRPGFQGARIARVPVLREGTRPRSPFEVTFPSSMLWGLISCAGTFAVSMVLERTRGTLQRLRVAPIARAHILGGKALACFLACLATVGLLLAISRTVFGVRVENPAGFAIATVCASACFVGMMMLLSVLSRTEQGVAGASWGAMLPMAMIGGGMIPLIAMPEWMLKVSHLSPVKWGIVALEGSIWRGFSLRELALPCAILVAVGAASFTAGAIVASRRD